MAKGSVRKKGKKWYYRFYIEDESGNLVQREFVGTESKSETEALLRKAMEDYEEKKFVAKSENATVGMLLDMWVEEELKPGSLSNGTVMAYQGTVNRIKQHPIGSRKLKTVTADHLQAYMDFLSFGGTNPDGTTAKALASRQPKVSFYTNYSYLVAGSLLYKDQRTMSELASGAIGRATLRAKGATDDQAVAFLQPIVIDSHILNNPWLNYSVYLSNTIIPGILMLLIFMTTIYTIGSEIKGNTQKEWMQMADNSVTLALSGKLLPQTLIFFIMATFYNVYLYGFLHYPCNSGILPMLLTGLLLVLASQAFGIFLFGLFTTMRLALSTASLWGVISFSISGMSFPVMAMNPVLQGLACLFPLRHYFLIYVNLALNGYPLIYAWHSVVALMLFMLLPFFILKRLRTVLLHYVYIP